MYLLKIDPAINRELEFYARFPEEIEMCLEEDTEIVSDRLGVFGDEYATLFGRIEAISDFAGHQSKKIIDAYVSKLATISCVKIVAIKRQGEWSCKLNCFPIKKPPSRWNVLIGVSVDTYENKLTVWSWIWVRGAQRNKILEVLRRDVVNCDMADKTPNEGAWEGTLAFLAENLLDVANRKESLNDLVDRLANPILQISKERWLEICDLPRK